MLSWHERDLNKNGSLIFCNGQRFIMSVASFDVSKISIGVLPFSITSFIDSPNELIESE